jgi:hypothetical protein
MLHRAHVTHRLNDVAGAGLALGADHGRALADAAQGLAQVAAAADERHLETVLGDVVLLVGGRKDLALVDEVHAQRLQDLCFSQVTDAALGHHRDRDRGLDLADEPGVRHARHAALAPDDRGDALERHHRAGAGLLGNACLVGGHDIHDHATLEHLGQTHLQAKLLVLIHGSSPPCR